MMDVKEFREMCELRLALEGHAAALAAQNHSAADLREIKFALEAMRKLTDRILASTEEAPFFDELSRQDVRFHIAIMAAAKNDLMKREILRLHLLNKIVAQRKPRPGQVSKAESDENRRRVMASHDEIFQAIEAGDPVATKAAMEKHIQDIIDKSVNAFSKSSALVPRELTEEELVYGV
jgi:DNA-binding GntR family transcriptional regulator